MTSSLPLPAADQAPGVIPTTNEPKRVGIVFIVVYALTMLGFWMSLGLPSTVTLALRVAEIDPLTKTTSYSLVAGVGALFGLIAAPIFGQLSDYTRSRFGRRRPWIVVGLVGITTGAVIIGLSDSIAMMIVGWVFIQFFLNAGIAAMFAIVADRVPESQRGLLGALAAMTSSCSVVIGLPLIEIFPTNVFAQFVIPVSIAVVFGTIMLIIFKEDRPYTGAESYGIKQFFGSFAFNPRRTPDFAKLIAAIFLFFMGAAVIGTYGVYFLQDHLGIPPEQLTSVLFASSIAPAILTIIIAPLTGWVTDRLGRRKPALFIAAPLAAASIVLVATATDVTQYVIGFTIASGVAGAIVSGAFIPFVIATIKDQSTIARNLGLANVAMTIPFSVVPFFAPLLLGLGVAAGGEPNYILLYVVAGIAVLGSIPLIAAIRHVR